jgi:hypothetical protein
VDGVERWGLWTRLGGSAALGGPTVVRASNDMPYIAYVAPNGEYRLASRAGNQWFTTSFLDAGGNVLARPANSRFTPGLIEADLGWRPGERRLYALLAAADDHLDLWALDTATGRWERTDVLETRPGPVSGSPSMGFAPATSAGPVGRLYVAYVARDSGMATMLTSYVEVTAGGRRQRVGLTGPFDNVWLTTPGIDLLYEPNVRTLRAVLVRSGGRGLEFRPKADGIQDFRYVNYDDWPVLGRNLCRGVVNPGGLVTRPIRC